jgi:hypothetical protein
MVKKNKKKTKRKELKNYYVVPSKNKVTGELLDIKIFTDFGKAQEYQLNRYKENVGEGKFIEKPIIGNFAYNEEESIRKAQCAFPEHCLDSRDTLKLFKKSLKEEFK